MTEKREFLEIHHISVSNGDATVIAVNELDQDNKITKCDLIFIDFGATEKDIERIEKHCTKAFGGNYNVKYIIFSHSHWDHKGEFLGKKRDFFVKENPIIFHGQPSKDFDSKFYKIDELIINDDETKEIKIHDEVSLTCYCASRKLPNKEITNNSKNEEPNNNSLAWVLKYKEFIYFTAGDLSGSEASNYMNMEKPLLDYLYDEKGPLKGKNINVLKASHHGSKYNMFGYDNESPNNNKNSFFLDKLKPEYIVLTCNKVNKLPDQEFFLRVTENKEIKERIKGVYLVNEFDRDIGKIKKDDLDLDEFWYDCKKTNIVKKNNSVINYSIDEESRKYPVCIVFVNEKGEVNIKHQGAELFEVEVNDIKEKTKSTGKFINNIPTKISKYVFEDKTEDGESFFYKEMGGYSPITKNDEKFQENIELLFKPKGKLIYELQENNKGILSDDDYRKTFGLFLKVNEEFNFKEAFDIYGNKRNIGEIEDKDFNEFKEIISKEKDNKRKREEKKKKTQNKKQKKFFK